MQVAVSRHLKHEASGGGERAARPPLVEFLLPNNLVRTAIQRSQNAETQFAEARYARGEAEGEKIGILRTPEPLESRVAGRVEEVRLRIKGHRSGAHAVDRHKNIRLLGGGGREETSHIEALSYRLRFPIVAIRQDRLGAHRVRLSWNCLLRWLLRYRALFDAAERLSGDAIDMKRYPSVRIAATALRDWPLISVSKRIGASATSASQMSWWTIW